MSGKPASHGGSAAPHGPNVLLYVGPHAVAGSHNTKGPVVEEEKQFIPHNINERKVHMKDENSPNISQMHFPNVYNGMSVNKDPAQMNNILPIDNGLRVQPGFTCKPIMESGSVENINCIPNGLTNSFVGLQNISGCQRVVQTNSFSHMIKVNEKSINGQVISGNICAGNFIEHVQNSGKMMALSQTEERLSSDAGESCSSMSSGDSHSGDGSGNNIVIMQPNMHIQQNQNPMIMNPNANILNQGPVSNVLASNMGGGQIDNNNGCQNIPANFQMMNQGMSQSVHNNEGMSVGSNSQMNSLCVGSDGVQQLSSNSGRDGMGSGGMGSGNGNGAGVGQSGVEGEIVIVNNVAHQVVRTPTGGIVLGVLPRPRQVQGHCVSAPAPAPTDHSNTIGVPLGWSRMLQGSNICYISPSGAMLCSLDQVREYLQSAGTCKCGLDCPLRPEVIFNFDPKVMSKPNELPAGLKLCEMWRGCAGKRRAGPPCPSPTPSPSPTSPAYPEDKKQPRSADGELSIAKKRKRKGNPYAGVSVSQLLAQRESVHQQQQMQFHQQIQQRQNIQNQLQLQHFHQQQMCSNQTNAHPSTGVQQQNAWIHPHIINSNSPHPCESASPTVAQMRFSNVQENNTVNRNMMLAEHNARNMMFIGSQQLPNKNEDSSNSSSSLQCEGIRKPNNIVPQIITVNGTPQTCMLQDQRPLQHSNLFNQQQNMHFSSNSINNQNEEHCQVNVSNNFLKNQNLACATNESRNKMCNEAEDIPKSDENITANKICDKITNDNEIQKNPTGIQISTNGLMVPVSQSPPSNQSSNIVNITDLHNLPPEVIEKINQQQQIFIQNNQKQMELAMKSIKTHVVPGNSNISPMEMKLNQSNMPSSKQVLLPNNNQRVPPWHLNRMNSVQQNLPVQNFTKNNQPILPVQFNSNNVPQNMMNHMQQRNLNMNELITPKSESDNIYSRVPPLHHDVPPMLWVEQESVKKTKSPKGNKKVKSIDNQGISNKPNQPLTVTPMNHSPSCIEDPSGYLAQQAAYMSRQLGMAHMMNPCDDMKNQNFDLKNNSKPFNSRNNPSKNIGETISRNSPSHNTLPDSSVNCDKSGEINKHSHCRGCIAEMNESKNNSGMPYQTKIKNYIESLSSMKSESSSQPGTPSPNQCSDDSPVTSSTYGERPGSRSNNFSGPIQGRIISTSNGSPMESYQIPELSPTPSNSSRNTDTPQSKTSNNGYNISSSCPYPNSSPAYSYQGSSRESTNSNPATPSPGNTNQNYSSYSSPEPISNVNQMPLNSTNKMEATNIKLSSMPLNNPCNNIFPSTNNTNECAPLQMKPVSNNFNNQRIPPNQSGPFTFFMSSTGLQNTNSMPMSLANEIVTTVAGHTLIRNTITSVLAGKAQTATTSINGSPSVMPQLYPSIGNSNAIIHHNNAVVGNSSNSPLNYPLHIAGSVVQSLVTKSPLEMVQNVVSNIKISQTQTPSHQNNLQDKQQQIQNANLGQVIMSGNNQILINGSPQGSGLAPMPPPPPKGQASDIPVSSNTNTSITQTMPAANGVPQVINHPTVVVNTIPAPFMLQPQMVAVDNQVVNQNVPVPQIVSGNVIPQGQAMDGNTSAKSPGAVNRPALLSPDSGKKKGKKRKPPSPVASVMQIPTQHNSGNLLVQHNTQQPQQFVSQGFQMSPNGNITSTPMLQALTIVPGKGGAPAHIVMNGQAASNFGSQQIINPQGHQHINLLQPVNLLNAPTGVMQNFPTFQQFIVPGLGSMVMTADGTAILQDPSSMPMQLQIQNVNGQNVLTPIQNQGILTAGPAGMVIRTQNPNNKIMQSQHSPGAQFLSPTGGQIVMSGSPFNGQLSPLIANVGANQAVTFNNSPPQVRSNMQQEFLQCNQMGQTLMLPVSPNHIAVSSSSNQQNATYVQQNTTIVQQQTTMLANNQNQYQNVAKNSQSNNPTPILNVEHGIVVNQVNKPNNQLKDKVPMPPQLQQITVQTASDSAGVKRLPAPFTQIISQGPQMNPDIKNNDVQIQQNFGNFNQNNHQDMNLMNPNYRSTVSTQTLVNQQQTGNKSPIQTYTNQSSGASPPDTTTHSPLGSLDGGSNGSPTNSMSGRSPNSVHGNQVDTTTASPEPLENNSLAMVQCVSSSEPDSVEHSWGKSREKHMDVQVDMIMHNSSSPQRPNNIYSVDSSGIHFNNQTITVSSLNNQQNLTITPANYYEKKNFQKYSNNNGNSMSILPANNLDMNTQLQNSDKSKCETKNIFSKPPPSYFATEKMQLNNMVNGLNQMNMQKNLENANNCPPNNNYNRRMSLSSRGDEGQMDDNSNQMNNQLDIQSRQFKEGDLVWGPAKGYPAWPGKLITKNTINGKEDGKVLVRWFGGDRCLTVLDSSNLQTLSEGLEAHHAARTKCRKSRKLNSQLEKAIQEAMAELDRITETKEIYNEIKTEEMIVEDADINGNSSKSLMKTITRNSNKTVSEFVSKSESKAKWSHKKESKTRAGSAVVKIAPHPGSVSSNMAQPSGRLRSSQR